MDHEGKATEAVAPGVGTPPGTPSRSTASPSSAPSGTPAGSTPTGSNVGGSKSKDPARETKDAVAKDATAKEPPRDDSPRGEESVSDEAKRKVKARPRPPAANHLRKFREELCLSQAELARRANLSALTVARIEQGYGCRMSTKRKILEALGLSLADRKRVFGEEE